MSINIHPWESVRGIKKRKTKEILFKLGSFSGTVRPKRISIFNAENWAINDLGNLRLLHSESIGHKKENNRPKRIHLKRSYFSYWQSFFYDKCVNVIVVDIWGSSTFRNVILILSTDVLYLGGSIYIYKIEIGSVSPSWDTLYLSESLEFPRAEHIILGLHIYTMRRTTFGCGAHGRGIYTHWEETKSEETTAPVRNSITVCSSSPA